MDFDGQVEADSSSPCSNAKRHLQFEFVDMLGLHWGVVVTGTQSNLINLHSNWWWQLAPLNRSTTRSDTTHEWCWGTAIIIYSHFLWIELNSSQVASMATIEFYFRWKPVVAEADPHYIMGVSCLLRFNLISFKNSRNSLLIVEHVTCWRDHRELRDWEWSKRRFGRELCVA
jgi:hypothetical protein